MRLTRRGKLIICGMAVIVIAIILELATTFSSFFSSKEGGTNLEVASVYLDSTLNEAQTVFLESISPNEASSYTFSIVNFENDVVSDVTQDYTITLKTFGNIPFDYKIEVVDPESGNVYSSTFEGDNYELISTGGVLLHSVKQTHTYKITIDCTDKMTDPDYSREIDAIEIIVDSVQKG